MSKTAMAPPQVEHGRSASEGQLPMAEFPSNVLFWIVTAKLEPGPDTDTAPPLAALQLRNLHSDMTTLLPAAEIAPPFAASLLQLEKVTPVIVTLEFKIMNAAPALEATRRRLQSKMVASGIPLMMRVEMLPMLTTDSLNTPALKLTTDAPS
jgi:hypothetical protein